MDELFCIWHCEKILCATPPEFCPLCHGKISYKDIPPVVSLDNLFTNGHDLQGRLSVLLKPTEGIWAPTTHREDDLHIGVSDSFGGVFNYFLSGPIVDKCGWEQCVVVFDVPQSEARIWKDLWIRVIGEMIKNDSWSITAYDETMHNCFDFVIQFLIRFKNEITRRCGDLTELNFLAESSNMQNLKNVFVNDFVIDKMRTAATRIRNQQDIAQRGFTTFK